MKTIVLLTGEFEARESFHNVTKDYGIMKIDVLNEKGYDEFGEIQKYSSGVITNDLNEQVCNFVEDFSTGEFPTKIFVLENYSKRLSRMLQDDFMAFEIEVNKTGILSKGNCCFCLNVKDENFAEQARELVSKLSI